MVIIFWELLLYGYQIFHLLMKQPLIIMTGGTWIIEQYFSDMEERKRKLIWFNDLFGFNVWIRVLVEFGCFITFFREWIKFMRYLTGITFQRIWFVYIIL